MPSGGTECQVEELSVKWRNCVSSGGTECQVQELSGMEMAKENFHI